MRSNAIPGLVVPRSRKLCLVSFEGKIYGAFYNTITIFYVYYSRIKMEFSVKQNQMSRDSWIWKEKIDNDVVNSRDIVLAPGIE